MNNDLHRATLARSHLTRQRRFMKRNYFGDFADFRGPINWKGHCSYDSQYLFDHCVGDPPQLPFPFSFLLKYMIVAFHTTSIVRIFEATHFSSIVSCEGNTLPSPKCAAVPIKSHDSNECQRENAVAKCILQLSIMQARRLRHPIPNLRI